MKAWIVSDIHSSAMDLFLDRRLGVPKADICICAGDIANSIERSIDFLFAEVAPHMPVVAALGNHDYHGSSIDRALEYARRSTAGTNVHILENEEFRREDLRVVGATLWTDFEIAVHSAAHVPVGVRPDIAVRFCRQHLPDFKEIYRSDERADGEDGFLTPAEMIARHEQSRAYIDATLTEPFDGTTVVLTHHAPSARSLNPRFGGHITNAAFASDLSALIQARKPKFWVHGHVHCFQDYFEGETRVLCNPRGHLKEPCSIGFRPGFVVETTVEEG